MSLTPEMHEMKDGILKPLRRLARHEHAQGAPLVVNCDCLCWFDFNIFKNRMQSSIRKPKEESTMSEAITKDNLILGHKYRETLLDREGTAYSRTEYITGCDLVTLLYLDKDGRQRSFMVAINLLEAVFPKNEREDVDSECSF